MKRSLLGKADRPVPAFFLVTLFLGHGLEEADLLKLLDGRLQLLPDFGGVVVVVAAKAHTLKGDFAEVEGPVIAAPVEPLVEEAEKPLR